MAITDEQIIEAAEQFAARFADDQPIDPDGDLNGEMLRRVCELARKEVTPILGTKLGD
ncbi:MAG: hypothetical protein H0X36_00310 [Sphingomonadaceae bacterium]|nr:hypothetical protein [Sphingomonadaceae bacterium]